MVNYRKPIKINDMLTEKKAKEISMLSDIEMNKILSKIKKRAKKGKRFLHLYEYVTPQQDKDLKCLGYCITKSFEAERYVTVISWY